MKVYVVEVGEYSDRFVDAIFTTKELAEAWVEHKTKVAYEAYARRVERDFAPWKEAVTAGDVIYRGEQEPRAFEDWAKHDRGNDYGYVTEYDLWDVIPAVTA